LVSRLGSYGEHVTRAHNGGGLRLCSQRGPRAKTMLRAAGGEAPP